MGTQDLDHDTHRRAGYNSTWALRFTATSGHTSRKAQKSEVADIQVLPCHGRGISKNSMGKHPKANSRHK